MCLGYTQSEEWRVALIGGAFQSAVPKLWHKLASEIGDISKQETFKNELRTRVLGLNPH